MPCRARDAQIKEDDLLKLINQTEEASTACREKAAKKAAAKQARIKASRELEESKLRIECENDQSRVRVLKECLLEEEARQMVRDGELAQARMEQLKLQASIFELSAAGRERAAHNELAFYEDARNRAAEEDVLEAALDEKRQALQQMLARREKVVSNAALEESELRSQAAAAQSRLQDIMDGKKPSVSDGGRSVSEQTLDDIKARLLGTQLTGQVSEDTQDDIKAALRVEQRSLRSTTSHSPQTASHSPQTFMPSFDQIDTNHDGVIDRSEFARMKNPPRMTTASQSHSHSPSDGSQATPSRSPRSSVTSPPQHRPKVLEEPSPVPLIAYSPAPALHSPHRVPSSPPKEQPLLETLLNHPDVPCSPSDSQSPNSSRAGGTQLRGQVSEDTQDDIKAGLAGTQLRGQVSEETQSRLRGGLVGSRLRSGVSNEMRDGIKAGLAVQTAVSAKASSSGASARNRLEGTLSDQLKEGIQEGLVTSEQS
jgi:hypothetical protein